MDDTTTLPPGHLATLYRLIGSAFDELPTADALHAALRSHAAADSQASLAAVAAVLDQVDAVHSLRTSTRVEQMVDEWSVSWIPTRSSPGTTGAAHRLG